MAARARTLAFAIVAVLLALGLPARAIVAQGVPLGPRPWRPDAVVLRGRLLAPDGSSAGGLRVTARGGAWADSADVADDGSFELTLPEHGSVDVLVDARDPAQRRWHPARLAMDASGALLPLRLVLVPLRWTIGRGRYAGETVDIRVEDALARAWPGGFWRVARRPRRAVEGTADDGAWSVAWPSLDRRIPVAFSRTPRWRVSAADSAQFWALVRELEEVLGDTLFRPAASAEIEEEEGVLVEVDRAIGSAGVTNITWGQRGDAYDAVVRVQSPAYLTDPRIIMHEMMHVLGVGHTRAWASVMSPGGWVSRPTARDVAYAQLLLAIHRTQSRTDAGRGLLEALDGAALGVALRDARP